MDTIVELISVLGNDDIKDFKSFLKKKNKRNDVKNIRLIEILETDDINRLKKLYASSKNKDAYHALRKRLHDSLLLFISNKTFERDNSEAHEALRLLIVGRFLLENDLIKPGFKCLQRAEQKALLLEQFSLLNEILQLRLQYAYLESKPNLELLIDRLVANQHKMQQEVKFQIAYAFLRVELQDIHLKGKIVDLNRLVIDTIGKYDISLRQLLSFKSLYQLLFIANEYATIHQNYALVRSFLKTSDEFITKQKVNSGHHLFYYLHILYYLANFNLRNGLFHESLAYLEQLIAGCSPGSVLRVQFHLRYYLLKALNYHYMGEGVKALAILRLGIQQSTLKSNETDIADLQLCLVMFLTQFQDKLALTELRKLIRTDAWYEKKMGMLWTIRKSLLEILIHIQFEDIDLAISRVKSFRRRYKQYLETVREGRVVNFLRLVEKYLQNPSIVKNNVFMADIEAMTDRAENQDLFVLGFIAWLKSLVTSESPYQALLSLVKKLELKKDQ
ncbi:hypothetical protein OHD16_07965 [Sphingobacterium sp. ML3W]|uniref:hypothetical protein n=1 Tax=Sphingobacterium sp. ML3W TaxID=1538644 RepID=UPI00249A17F8|nr:hypothetical protein [Sphingobacterium sp. ML3W]WFA79892.1 hypothetical protein OGI71_01105 [Sphingobacterium sp. ML3W]